MLTRDDGKLDITRMSSLVDQIVWLRQHDYEVILVSSGSITCGRDEVTIDHKLDSVSQRQLFSALGQVKLVGLYYDLFREYGVHIGQVLTMKESFSTRGEYLNQRACMMVMLENGVLPIVNENDTISVTEPYVHRQRRALPALLPLCSMPTHLSSLPMLTEYTTAILPTATHVSFRW